MSLPTTETTGTVTRRGIHIPVDEIVERARDVDPVRLVTLSFLAIPYFLCFMLAWIATRLVAACQEGWAAGKRPKGKR